MTTLKTSSVIFPVNGVLMAALTTNGYQTVALVARASSSSLQHGYNGSFRYPTLPSRGPLSGLPSTLHLHALCIPPVKASLRSTHLSITVVSVLAAPGIGSSSYTSSFHILAAPPWSPSPPLHHHPSITTPPSPPLHFCEAPSGRSASVCLLLAALHVTLQ